MPLYDISVTLSPALPRFPGDPPVRFRPHAGEPFRLTRLAFGSHAGTHLDASAHLLPQGAPAGELPLERLLGPCLVLDLSGHAGDIDAAALRRLPLHGHRRLLLHTRNSALWRRRRYSRRHVGLTPDAAAWLVERGVKLVGIDYLSVEPAGGDGSVHRLLLEGGVVVLEGLDLSAVEHGEYELLCLPLKLSVADGAPCRAVLRRPDTPPPRPEHHTRWPP
jgi:arylformamidase